MKWSGLPKEKKQVMVLGALLGVTGIYVVTTLVLLPALETLGSSRDELISLREKLVQIDADLNTMPRLEKERSQKEHMLREADRRYVPPKDNPLAWATAFVYHHARRAGLEIEGVAEERTSPPPWARGRDAQPRQFNPYMVRINMVGGYMDTIRLIDSFERENPVLTIKDIMIQPSARDPEKHQIAITVEWPQWRVAGGWEEAHAALLAAPPAAGQTRRR